MKRREFIGKLGLLAGGIAGGSALLGIGKETETTGVEAGETPIEGDGLVPQLQRAKTYNYGTLDRDSESLITIDDESGKCDIEQIAKISIDMRNDPLLFMKSRRMGPKRFIIPRSIDKSSYKSPFS